jgi:hypothetical protein
MMSTSATSFELPTKIDQCLAVLSKLYLGEGQRKKAEILVNAEVRVREGWTFDNWNGGTHGHAVYLAVPEDLYLEAARQRGELQDQIREELNATHNVQNEFVAEVFIESLPSGDGDWRRESGLLRVGRSVAPPEAIRRVWGPDGYRVFLSHKAEVKKETAELKARLALFGISGFVAHQDISPTREWQDEIEHALRSMDAFVALLTERFRESNWTDQEVGFALGREVPIIAIRLGKDPYGFIGKFQALSCDWDSAPKEVVRLLLKRPAMIDAFIGAAQRCSSFDHGNILAEALPHIEHLSEQLVERLVTAFNANAELRGSFGFNGTKPRYYGDGLATHLTRLTGREYRFSGVGSGMRISA